MRKIIKLDYSIESPEERKALVEKILSENPNPPSSYLEILATYLVLCMEKQERKKKKLLTENRLCTINKHETSFEGLVSQLKEGEDGIYNLISDNKNALFQPKVSITKEDLREVPYLKQLREEINKWDVFLKRAEGKEAYIIKKSLIEMRKDQYIIKQAYRRPIICTKLIHSTTPKPELEDKTTMRFDGELTIEGISLLDPNICSAILCNYSRLKQDNMDDFTSDTYYLIKEFEEVVDLALREDHPYYFSLLIYKIDGKSNQEIQKKLQEEFGIFHSQEYISNLWRKKIPNLIAHKATELFYLHEYKKRRLPTKICNRCGRTLPANNFFFSKNCSSYDGFYSLCKECRNKKKGVE